MRVSPGESAQRLRKPRGAKQAAILANALDRRRLQVPQFRFDLAKRFVFGLRDLAEENAGLTVPLALDGDGRDAGPVLVQPRPWPWQERPAQLGPALRDESHRFDKERAPADARGAARFG